MPLKIINGKLLNIKCDAIVNCTNKDMIPTEESDLAVHKAAGEKLLKKCKSIARCAMGDSVITKGYNSGFDYIIHTCAPVWNGGKSNEDRTLRSCYRRCLKNAQNHKVQTVAFPLIKSKGEGYPKEKILDIAVDEIKKFLLTSDMMVYIVIENNDCFVKNKEIISSINKYVEDNFNPSYKEEIPCAEKSFASAVLEFIEDNQYTEDECYKRANIDRKSYAKITIKNQKPSKLTALAFAISLCLNEEETRYLLSCAGYSFSDADKFDVVIKYFINEDIFDIYKINEILFELGFELLGI